MLQVRYFAAAKAALERRADAVGIEALSATAGAGAGATLGDLVAWLVADAPHAAPVLERCSFLVDGVSTKDRATPLTADSAVDVLPPFAGG